MRNNFLAAYLPIILFAIPAHADQIVADDLIVQGDLCVGNDCKKFEDFFWGGLKIKDGLPRLHFADTDEDQSDWFIMVNNEFRDFFSVTQIDYNPWVELRTPFEIEGNAPTAALYIASDGDVGMGTQFPGADLHIIDQTWPTIRLEQDGTAGGFVTATPGSGNGASTGFSTGVTPRLNPIPVSYPAKVWEAAIHGADFVIRDGDTSSTPLRIRSNAPSNSVFIANDGDIGFGTPSPQGKLHTVGEGVQLAYFESTDGDAVQIRMRSDSENRRFLATDNADKVKTQIIFGDSNIRFAGPTDSGGDLWLTVGPAGIVTQGPTCGSPCDAAFDPEAFTPLSIEDHAASMWENRYLGAIGPTSPDQPVNLTEKLGGVIHELEVAHIYIEELNGRLQVKDAEVAELKAQLATQGAHMEAVLARIAALEAATAD